MEQGIFGLDEAIAIDIAVEAHIHIGDAFFTCLLRAIAIPIHKDGVADVGPCVTKVVAAVDFVHPTVNHNGGGGVVAQATNDFAVFARGGGHLRARSSDDGEVGSVGDVGELVTAVAIRGCGGHTSCASRIGAQAHGDVGNVKLCRIYRGVYRIRIAVVPHKAIDDAVGTVVAKVTCQIIGIDEVVGGLDIAPSGGGG